MGDAYLDDPDVRLMLRVRDGDAGAFEALVAAHAPALVNFVHKYVGSAGAAEDLAQEVFLKVYRAAPGYVPTARFRTWLMTIAANLCLNQKRWESKRPHQPLESAEAGGPSPHAAVADRGEGPGKDLERSERRASVRRAIQALPPQQRAAVVLARFELMSYAEIAATMGLTVMAVKSLLNRARENLREMLWREMKDHGVAPSPR